MKISIITAVYNSKRTIAGAIESVQNQSYPDLEHIIVDGISNDGTLEIVKKYFNSDRFDSPKVCIELESREIKTELRHEIILLSGKDKNTYDALNKGILHSKGEIVGLLHADDIFYDEFVIEKVATVFKNSGCDIVYGDLLYVNSDDMEHVVRYWKSGAFTKNRLYFGWMPPHPTVFIRRELLHYTQLYNTDFEIASDYDFILRYFNTDNYKIEYIPEILVKMRIGGKSNKNLSQIARKSREDYSVLRHNRLPFPLFTLLCKNIRKLTQFMKHK